MRETPPLRELPTRGHPGSPPREAMTTPDEGAGDRGVPLARLVLGLLLAIVSAVTIEIAGFLVLAGVDALTGTRSSAVATAVLDAAGAAGWFVAGGVAYEVVRERVAVVIVALVPLIIALLILLAGVSGAHLLVWGGLPGVIAYAVALGVVTCLGGAAWARHLRPSPSIDSRP